ncbi:MAG: methyl-accepting chemotaxis protein [Clostridium sp.]
MKKKIFMRNMSNRIMTQIIALIIIICSLISILSFIQTKSEMIDITYEKLENKTQDCVQAIKRELEASMDDLRHIAELPAVKTMDYSIWKDPIYRQSVKWGFDAIYIFDTNGIAYYTDDTTQDYSQDSYFADIQEKKEYISDPWFDVDNLKSVSTLITPIMDDNEEIIGYMCGTLNLERMNEIVGNIKIGEEGYAFVIDENGQIVSHNDMNKAFDGVNIKDLAADEANRVQIEKMITNIQNGENTIENIVLDDVDAYISHGKIDNTLWSLVVVSPTAEILKSIKSVSRTQGVLTIIGIVLSVLISIFIRRQLAILLSKITKYSEELSNCNLTYKDESNIDSIEFRSLVDSLNTTVDTLNETISGVKSSSDQIASSSEEIDGMIVNISSELEQSAAAVEEISASMEECAASISEVNSMVQKVDDTTKISADISEDVLELSHKIENQSNSLHEEALNSRKHIECTFDKCKKDLEKALSKVTVVKNISTMSDSIMSISEQTNLLSLNASIEAARAGEHGKGFAVVANEVKKLAEQSTSTVTEIQEKVNEALDAVQDLSLTSKELLEIVQKDILNNYNKVIDITKEYKESGVNVKKMSEEFSGLSEEIRKAVSFMRGNIEGLSEVITNVSDSTNVIAENMSTINSNNELIVEKSHDNKNLSKNLIETVKKFKV